MALYNIVDGRKKRYRWKTVNAVIENTSHDNPVNDSDQIEEPSEGGILYQAKKNISVHDAIAWAESQECPVTLFLYDQGDGIS